MSNSTRSRPPERTITAGMRCLRELRSSRDSASSTIDSSPRGMKPTGPLTRVPVNSRTSMGASMLSSCWLRRENAVSSGDAPLSRIS